MSGCTNPSGGCVAGGFVVPGSTVGGTNDGAGVGSNRLEQANAGDEALRKAMPTSTTNTSVPPIQRSRFRLRSRNEVLRGAGRRERLVPLAEGLGRREDVVKGQPRWTLRGIGVEVCQITADRAMRWPPGRAAHGTAARRGRRRTRP